MATNAQIATVAEHYLSACIWADSPEEEDDDDFNPAKATEKFAFEECKRFINVCGPLFDQAVARFEHGYGQHPDAGCAEAAFGHDFWLTRQGHGVGFWDRPELGKELGAALTNLVGYGTKFPEVYPEFYQGKLYFN